MNHPSTLPASARLGVVILTCMAMSLLCGAPPATAQVRYRDPADLFGIPESPPAHPAAAPSQDCCDRAFRIGVVYPHSGEFHLEEVDMVIPGRGFDFVWQRTYRSRLLSVGESGNGWDFSYNLKIEPGEGGLWLNDGNGRRDFYHRRPNNTFVSGQFFRE